MNTDRFEARARDILADTPLIDGHNDVAWALRKKVGLAISEVDLRGPQPDLDTDIPRLRAGRVGGQFWSVWVPAELPEPDAVVKALEQIDIIHGLVERYPETFGLARGPQGFRDRSWCPCCAATSPSAPSASRIGKSARSPTLKPRCSSKSGKYSPRYRPHHRGSTAVGISYQISTSYPSGSVKKTYGSPGTNSP